MSAIIEGATIVAKMATTQIFELFQMYTVKKIDVCYVRQDLHIRHNSTNIQHPIAAICGV